MPEVIDISPSNLDPSLCFIHPGISHRASLVAQTVKRLPTMQETRVQSLGPKIPWRRKWQPTPVFMPGKSHGLRILVSYSPWGGKELDTTEQLHFTSTLHIS